MKSEEDQISHRTATSVHGPSDSTFESTSSPGTQESFSIFADTSCGEPLCAQQITLDFTPVHEIDNDFVQKKCCAFWDYLYSRTDLHHLMVLPEKKAYDLNATSDLESSGLVEPEPEPHHPHELKEATAVSMLEFVEEKGLIDRIFEAKMPQSKCSLGSREYREKEFSRKLKPFPPRDEVCSCKGVCESCRGKPAGAAPLPAAAPDVQLMSSKMQDWDKENPKSMEPPGHAPALSHCVMQRKVTI